MRNGTALWQIQSGGYSLLTHVSWCLKMLQRFKELKDKVDEVAESINLTILIVIVCNVCQF